jgi:transcriptional regulator with XRE-family HTH domain
MSARNKLLAAVPYEVEDALKVLGTSLRTARLRRNLSLADVAQKLGCGRQAVAGAENGKPSAGIVIYAGLLWIFGMTHQLASLADPLLDEEGMVLASQRDRIRARRPEPDGNDF